MVFFGINVNKKNVIVWRTDAISAVDSTAKCNTIVQR